MAETMGERLAGAWARTDRIFEMLAPGAFLARPIALRHPFIFYVGHLPAFAWNHICGGVLGRPSLDAGVRRDLLPRHRSRRGRPDHGSRLIPRCPIAGRRSPRCWHIAIACAPPSCDSVDAVAERAGTHLMARDGRVFAMVIEHELMHQETLLYMLHAARPRPEGPSRLASAL